MLHGFSPWIGRPRRSAQPAIGDGYRGRELRLWWLALAHRAGRGAPECCGSLLTRPLRWAGWPVRNGP